MPLLLSLQRLSSPWKELPKRDRPGEGEAMPGWPFFWEIPNGEKQGALLRCTNPGADLCLSKEAGALTSHKQQVHLHARPTLPNSSLETL